jgi:hypothetical protein
VDVFQCATDAQCVSERGAGRCQSTGRCSFGDPSCVSGQRYGAYAPEDLADQCVGVAATVGSESYRALVLEDRPVAYWRLGESSGTVAKDEVVAHPGTYVGVLGHGPGAIPSDSDGAMTGTGQGGYVRIGDVFDFAGGKPFTLEAWVKPTRVTAYKKILGKRAVNPSAPTIAPGYEIGLADLPRGLYFAAQSSAAAQLFIETGIAPPPDRFTHVAVVFDELSFRIFLDGEVIVSRAWGASQLEDTGWDFVIANGSLGGAGTSLDGSVDEVALYDHALSPDRVKAHHAFARRP